ncbi:hypothetical protein [Burkholderia thailandensis]|uniref:hypothetical protein n=1 Tax=Burkholderia thailandensis TaxID=57975 RepID=UPI0005F10EC3|nr:hypothetical protein [Burkholderia thailandensis]AOJ55453.1 hypothetical protein AQ477_02270 [Burkholderia thailandensis]KXF60545.1 hypothetical protein AQ476_04060 [Burkholderia thailandensis]PNE75400.1 hypothetical protein A8H37_27600 [Burkholderia thailandensis]
MLEQTQNSVRLISQQLLRQKIFELVAIDEQRQSAIPKEGISYFSGDRNQVEARQEYNGYAQSLVSVLGDLSDIELIVVMALATYGDRHGSFDRNAEFAEAMEDAREFVGTSKRDHVIGNLSPKKLSEYLPAGLKRAKLD